MKWLTEKPCSIVKAWNTLCQAVYERVDFYQLKKSSRNNYTPISELPALRRLHNIASMSKYIRSDILALVKYSYNWTQLGQWQETLAFGTVTYPHDPFFELCKVDGYAFFREGGNIPAFRHTASEFIKAAAGIVDFAVRYPSPTLAKAPNTSGFGINATLEGESFAGDIHIVGSSLDLIAIEMPSSTHPLNLIDNSSLAIWARRGRGRAYGHEWVYVCGEGRYINYEPVKLRGSCELRSRQSGLCTVGITDDDPQLYDLGMQNFIVDLDAGKSDRKLDLYPLSARAAEVWNTPKDDPEVKRSVYLSVDKAEVRLTESNFPPLPYKYME